MDCEENLRAAARELGRGYAAAVSAATEAARAGDAAFASNNLDVADGLFAQITSSPYRDLCLESAHYYNQYQAQNPQEAAEVQALIRVNCSRPPFNPYEFFVVGDVPPSSENQEDPSTDLIEVGRALTRSARACSAAAAKILRDHDGSRNVPDQALALLHEGYESLGALVEHGLNLTFLDYHQRSDVLRGMFASLHHQTECDLREDGIVSTPKRPPNATFKEGCIRRAKLEPWDNVIADQDGNTEDGTTGGK